MSKPIEDLSRLCVHTITTRPWKINLAAELFSAAGVKGISVWRDTLEGRDIAQTGRMLRDHDLEIVSLVRGGFFASVSALRRKAVIDENKRAIDEAAALGCPLVVLVCGADPEQALSTSRQHIAEGIEAILSHAQANNVKLAIEPLHPMYADTRSAINTLGQANDMVEQLESDLVGVAVDVYHVWWDPDLQNEIRRCGANGSLFAYHICDWLSPTADMLNDRGLMGDGCINLKQIRGWVEEAGFEGFHEVEIFSNRWWARDQHDFLDKIIEAYMRHS